MGFLSPISPDPFSPKSIKKLDVAENTVIPALFGAGTCSLGLVNICIYICGHTNLKNFPVVFYLYELLKILLKMSVIL